MRIRTVKPEFWTDEQMSSVSDFARLLALALLNYSDDEGYFLSNPILIRGACFPFLDDSKKIQRALQELSKIEFIDLGELSDGRGVGRIPSFRKHQRIDKPQVSKMKQNSQFQEHSKNDLGTFQEPSKTILGGNGKGMEGEIDQGMEIDSLDRFERFWEVYPKKVGKVASLTAWKKAKGKPSIDKVIQAVSIQAESAQWQKNGGQYIPNPATWINQGRWDDKPTEVVDPQSWAGIERKLLQGATSGQDHLAIGRDF